MYHQQPQVEQIKQKLIIAQRLIQEIATRSQGSVERAAIPQAQANCPEINTLEGKQSKDKSNYQNMDNNENLNSPSSLAIDLERLNPNGPEVQRNIIHENDQQNDEESSSSNQVQKLCRGKAVSKWKGEVGQKKGRFSPEEERILTNGVGQFLAIHQITYDDFIEMLTAKQFAKSVLSQLDFYNIMSNLLPNRSTSSCYKYLRRNFQKDTKKGKWDIEEQRKLMQLVGRYGKKWKKIAHQLGRYPADVSLKFQTIGSENASKRVKGTWTLSELVKLLEMVNKKLSKSILDPNIRKELVDEESHNMKDHLDHQGRTYNSSKFQHYNDRLVLKYLRSSIREIPLGTIPWSSIGKKMKTRSMIDCKNKFLQLLEMAMKSYKAKQGSIIAFIEGQNALEECQIDWQKWQGHDFHYLQAKNRFLFLKKLILNKSRKTFLTQLAELKQKMKVNGMY